MKFSPNPVDVYVGSRVRLRRTLLGMSQEKLGAAVNVSFQQIQKYERGSNRIGASRLWAFSRILGVPVAFFFDGYEATEEASEGFAEPPQESYQPDPFLQRETIEMLRALSKIDDAELRKRVLDLLRAIAGIDLEADPEPLDSNS